MGWHHGSRARVGQKRKIPGRKRLRTRYSKGFRADEGFSARISSEGIDFLETGEPSGLAILNPLTVHQEFHGPVGAVAGRDINVQIAFTSPCVFMLKLLPPGAGGVDVLVYTPEELVGPLPHGAVSQIILRLRVIDLRQSRRLAVCWPLKGA